MNDKIVWKAYHEAGHWVAADELEILTGSVSIVPNAEEGTFGRVSVEDDDGFFAPPNTDLYSKDNERAFKNWAMEQAIVDYAGHAAVVALLSIGEMTDASAGENGAHEDFEKAHERLGGDTTLIAKAKKRAVEIVTSRRDDISVIVEKLLQLGALDSQAVDILLGGHWSVVFNDDGTQKE